MNWEAIFGAVNVLAMLSWVSLILLPRWPALLSSLLYLVVGGLCLLYSSLIISFMFGWVDAGPSDGQGGFGSITEVQALFSSPGGLTIGWIHYLAFDLFVGIWIARDADAKNFSRFLQFPVLVLTFLAGPLGLLLWLIIREGRARAQGRWT